MERKIIKASPELKRIIGKMVERTDDDMGWDGISCVIFENNGILVYFKEYDHQQKISYEQLIEFVQHDRTSKK